MTHRKIVEKVRLDITCDNCGCHRTDEQKELKARGWMIRYSGAIERYRGEDRCPACASLLHEQEERLRTKDVLDRFRLEQDAEAVPLVHGRILIASGSLVMTYTQPDDLRTARYKIEQTLHEAQKSRKRREAAEKRKRTKA